MIELNNQIIEEAKPAKVYDGIWIKNINIESPNTDSCMATIIVAPYSSATGEILNTNCRTIVLNDVFGECASNQTLATAMTSIMSAVEHLINTRNTFQG